MISRKQEGGGEEGGKDEERKKKLSFAISRILIIGSSGVFCMLLALLTESSWANAAVTFFI